MVKNQFDDFDEFILWLKDDGIKPKTSERLWKKKIFTNLLNEHKNTLDNYKDFLLDKKLKNLIGKQVTYQNINELIFEITSNHTHYTVTMIDNSIIKVKSELIDDFIEKFVKEN